jgi:hypothetical protein
MPLIPDAAVFQKRLASLPLSIYQAGETVVVAGSRTDRRGPWRRARNGTRVMHR